ncbi:MAG: LamG-like jellyroll fold domain-containing protein [Aeromonas veronii]
MAASVLTAIGSFIADTLVAAGTSFLIADAVAIIATAYVAYSAYQMLRPKTPDFGSGLEGRKQMVRSPIAARTTIYGKAKVSGPIVFAGTTGDKNAHLHLVVPLASHEIDGVDAWYFGDDKLTLDGADFINHEPYVYTTEHAETASFTLLPGQETNTVDLAPLLPAGAIMGRVMDVMALAPYEAGSQIGGVQLGLSYTLDGTAVTANTHNVSDAFTQLLVHYTWDTIDSSVARIKLVNGAADQAAQPDLVAECGEIGWDDTHRLRGIAYAYARLKFDQEAWPYGIPNISAVVRGKLVYDPRTATTAWSDNPALCIRDYLLAQDGLRCAPEEIDETSFMAAANVCDELVPIPGDVVGDPYWDNTILLMHMDGFSDERGHAVSAVGGASLDDAEAVFDASMRFDGSTGYLSVDNSTISPIGAQDFTLEMWVRITATEGTPTLFSWGPSSGFPAIEMYARSSDRSIRTIVTNMDGNTIVINNSPASTWELNTWTHIALVRVAGRWKLFANGAVKRDNAIPAGEEYEPLLHPTNPIRIGLGWYNQGFMNGNIDELRFTVGVARYTDAFTPPSAPFVAVQEVVNRQKRYTLNGVVDSQKTPATIIQEMLSACGGSLIYTQGTYKLHAGAWTAPIGTLTESDLRGPIKVRAQPSMREQFNGVRGVFVNPEKNWQASDVRPIKYAPYITRDGGELWADIQMPFTIERFMAIRLAWQHLLRSRQGITVEMPCNLRAMKYSAWDVVGLDIARLGWVGKPFRIVSWRLADDGRGVDLVLQEDAEQSWEWDHTTETVPDPEPDTLLVDARVTTPPGRPTLREILIDNGVIRVQLHATWSPPENAFIAAYEVAWARLTGDTVQWNNQMTTSPNLTLGDVVSGATYVVRVRARNAIGRWSRWVYSRSLTIMGLFATPSPPQEFTATESDAGVLFSVGEPPDTDVKVGGYLEIRHAVDQPSNWNTAIFVGRWPGDTDSVRVLQRLGGRYFAKYVDSTGHWSTAVSMLVDDQQWTGTLDSINEAPAFTGAKTNCYVEGSALTFVGAQYVDDWGNIDEALDQWDRHGVGADVPASGSYVCAGQIDVGLVQGFTLVADIAAASGEPDFWIDDRVTLIDTWGRFDAAGDADTTRVATWFRKSDNGVDWSDWRRFPLAVRIRARYAETKLILRCSHGQRIDLTRLNFHAKTV